MSLTMQITMRVLDKRGIGGRELPESLERWTRDEPQEPEPPHNTFSGLWTAFKLELAAALLCWVAWQLWKAWR